MARSSGNPSAPGWLDRCVKDFQGVALLRHVVVPVVVPSALYVLGDQPVALGALSLGDIGMQMSKAGQVVSIGTGAACLGHPLRAAYWLARTMADRGQGLRAGEVILSGALGPMVPVSAGDLIHAQIGALGTVSCRLV